MTMDLISTMEVLINIGLVALIILVFQKVTDKSVQSANTLTSKDVELRIREFQNSLDVEKEKIRSEIESFRHRTNLLHVKRASIIERLYKRLFTLQRSVLQYTALIKRVPRDEEEQKKEEYQELVKLEEAFTNFDNYFRKNKIFFSPELCNEIHRLLKDYNEKIHDYLLPRRLLRDGLEPREIRFEAKKAREAVGFFRKEIPRRLAFIEDEFRDILQVK